jgi:pimeloyl-ACP methyl ester carboxylesterase
VYKRKEKKIMISDGKLTSLVPRLASTVLMLLALSVLTSQPASASSVTCQTFPHIPVALQGVGYHVWGELCATHDELSPSSGTATVQLLLHGATYGHVYWDLSSNPINGVSYSYARAEAAAGYPTFVLDRIGIDNSDHPPGALVDGLTNAAVVHQIVQGLKNGSITGTSFGKVILIGHSLGSTIAWIEAATYQDVAGVIITGLLHHLNSIAFANLGANLYPAGLDPRFRGQLWAADPGYLTSKPPPHGDVAHGFRAQLFYNTAFADLQVIAADEQTKETVTAAEFDALTSLSPTTSLQIQVPVLLIIAAKDVFFCDPTNPLLVDCSNSAAVLAQEAPYYSSAACLHAVPIPLSGHDISLHPNNNLQVGAALSWSDQFVGRSTSSQPPGCSH